MAKLLIMMIFIVSCGSITKRDDYIRVDSSPRGATVRYDNKLLGFTPMVIPKPKNKTATIKVGEKPVTLKCGFDWKHSVIPDALFTGYNPPIGLTYFAIDFLRDEMFVCPELSKTNVKKSRDLPYRYVFLPINRLSSVKRGYFISTISEIIQTITMDKKINFIPYDESLPTFLSSGLGFERDWNYLNADTHSVNKILHEHHATHAVEVKIGAKLAYINIYDIYSHKLVDSTSMEIPEDLVEKNELYRLTRKAVSFIPNAINVTSTTNGFTETNYQGDFSDNISVTNTKHPDALEGILGQTSISSVISPLYYDVYDYDFYIAPSAAFSSFRAQVEEYDRVDQVWNPIKNIDALIGYFTLDAVAAVITPAGNLSISYGLGMGVFDIDDEIVGAQRFAKPSGKVALEWTFFMGDRLYLNMGLRSFKTYVDPYSTEGLDLSSVSSAFFGIGLYLPEARSWIEF